MKCLTLISLLTLAAGCNIQSVQVKEPDLYTKITPVSPKISARGAFLSSIQVVDKRTQSEKDEREAQLDTIVAIFPVFWFSRKSGQTRTDPLSFSPTSLSDLQVCLTKALMSTKLFQNSGPDLRKVKLTLSIEELSVQSYTSSHSFISLTFSGSKSSDFAWYGHAIARLQIHDAVTEALISDRMIRGWSHDPDLATGEKAQQEAITQAIKRLFENTIVATEEALSTIPIVKALDLERSSVFFITRHTIDGLFTELASIEISSGTILSSVIQPRRRPMIAQPGVWVIPPYFGDVLLSPTQYEALISRLQRRYDVRYDGAIDIARFFGARSPADP